MTLLADLTLGELRALKRKHRATMARRARAVLRAIADREVAEMQLGGVQREMDRREVEAKANRR